MKLLLIALCAVVALVQAEDVTEASPMNAVELINAALDAFPVEKLVEALRKAAKMSYKRNVYILKVLDDLPGWDWQNADTIAEKLVPFNEDAQVKVSSFYSKILEKVGDMKTTSVREFLREHNPRLTENLDKLFELANGDGSSAFTEEALEDAIRTAHGEAKQRIELVHRKLTEFAAEVGESRGRRDVEAYGEQAVEFWDSFGAERNELIQTIMEYYVMYSEMLDEQRVTWMEENSEVPLQMKKKLVENLKPKVDRMMERMRECDIDAMIEEHKENIKMVAGHLTKFDADGKAYLQQVEANIEHITVWDALIRLKDVIFSQVNVPSVLSRLEDHVDIANEQYPTEEEFTQRFEARLAQLGQFLGKVSQGSEQYFQAIINHYNQRFGGRAGRRRRH